MKPFVDELWEDHFRNPAAAYARAELLLREGGFAHPAAAAWAELTVGFHLAYFAPRPTEAGIWLARAESHFRDLSERRGELLASAGIARQMLVEQTPLPARDRLLGIYSEAEKLLPPQDLFWVANALGAAYYYTDRIDEAIRYLHGALELLRTISPSPQLPAVMSNLAAALVTVGDYEPARELAQDVIGLLPHFDNPQLHIYARTNLAEALLGLGESGAALVEVDAMFPLAADERNTPSLNHHCAVAAETYAAHSRYTDAKRCVAIARTIHDQYPGGFNEVHYRWASAVLAVARGPAEAASAALLRAISAAERVKHLPTLCKAHALLAEHYAVLGRFEEAYRHQQQLMTANTQRLSNRARVKYYLLKVQHELHHARAERDRADRQRQETEALNGQLERLNTELQQKVCEVERLQAELAAEVMQDPLTGLFNRRYLDTVMPGLIAGAARREEPLALALVDLDHFKRINDRFGHPVGDAVLVKIGALFAASLRPSDVFCRYGGEEFCVALPDTDGAGALSALTSLAARLRELSVAWDDHTLGGFTFSAGVAVYPMHALTLPGLVATADRALYTAKGAGRDRVHLARAVPIPGKRRLRITPSAA